MNKSKKDYIGCSQLTKSSFVELKKDGKVKQRTFYYDRLENIRDPKWNHTDLVFMLREVESIPKEVREKHFLHSSGLFTIEVIPFSNKISSVGFGSSKTY